MMSDFPTRCCSERLRSTLPFPSSIPWGQRFSLSISGVSLSKSLYFSNLQGLFCPQQICNETQSVCVKSEKWTTQNVPFCCGLDFKINTENNWTRQTLTNKKCKKYGTQFGKELKSSAKIKTIPGAVHLFSRSSWHLCADTALICWFFSLSTYRECCRSNFETDFFDLVSETLKQKTI